MSLDFIDHLTKFQIGLAGTVLFFSDFFMHGILGRALFCTTKSLDDAMICILMRNSGVGLLGNFFSQIVASKEKDQYKRAFVIHKVFMFSATCCLYAHTAFFNPSDDFNRTTFAAFTITCLFNAIWLSVGLYCASGTSQQQHRKSECVDMGSSKVTKTSIVYIVCLWYHVLHDFKLLSGFY
jgi:hypothetical protein